MAVPTTSTWQVSSNSVARYPAAKGSSSTMTARIRVHMMKRNLARRQLTGFRSDGFQGSFRNIELLSKGNTQGHRGALTHLTPDFQLK